MNDKEIAIKAVLEFLERSEEFFITQYFGDDESYQWIDSNYVKQRFLQDKETDKYFEK